MSCVIVVSTRSASHDGAPTGTTALLDLARRLIAGKSRLLEDDD